MTLKRETQCVYLTLVLVCVTVNADVTGPAAAFDDPAKGNTLTKDSQESVGSDGSHQQPVQQFAQPQQQEEHHHHHVQKPADHPHVHQQSGAGSDDNILREAAGHQEHLHVSDNNRQGQLHQSHQHQQQDSQDGVHQHSHSELPLGQTDQDKARAHQQEVIASRGESQPDKEADHSEESAPSDAPDDKFSSDDDARTEAPHLDHLPLGQASVHDQQGQAQLQQAGDPLPQQQAGDPLPQQQAGDPLPQQQAGDPLPQQQAGDPLPQQQAGDPLPQQQAGDPLPQQQVDGQLQQQQTPPGVNVGDPLVYNANDRGQESSADAAGGGSSFEFIPEEAEQVPTDEEIEGERLFQAGEKLINATYYKEYKQAYLNFLRAAEFNHSKAKEYLAFGYLFGDYLPQNVTRATELFTELANRGSPKAQMGLAFMYSAGFNYNSSQAKALIYLTFSALGGEPLAQMALGYRYYAGIGVESKCETALTYYRKVAAKVAESVTLAGGQVVQRIRLQEEVESQGSSNGPLLDDDLLQYYHFLADKGDQQAQVVLGTLYYQGGKGVQINHEQAYHYFSTAAQAGSGHALGYLGKMHSEGSPVVTQNNHTALEYFKKSADKNNHIGQTGLGMMYLNGLGVEKDTSKAFRYFSLASDQGSVDAQLQLGIMYFTGNGVRKDYKMAVKYFTMSSQNGHVLAFYNLAQMHATGTGVLRNCHTAVELFKNVAERGRWSEMMMDAHRMYHEGSVDTSLVKYMFLAELGYEVAQSNVAYMLDSGVSSKFSQYETYQRALLQYSRAASQGSTNARLKMGDYHYYGLGTDIDYESAATHYRMASEQQHNAQAMFNLGYMHEKGLGLKQDIHLAKRFYDMAAETSLDAHVPVTLALFKLGIFYGMDVFSKEFEGVSGIFGLLDPAAYLGPEWDLYLASVLAFLFGVVYFLRRMR